MEKKIEIAILGTGNIGTDLLVKIFRSPDCRCSAFVGRREGSEGIAIAKRMGVETSVDSIDYILSHPDSFDILFDATSAESHKQNAQLFSSTGKVVVDLTPAGVGMMCIPAVNLEECLDQKNVNMVTCGGQASIPIAHAISQTHSDVEYIEVVSSISSKSAGPATRINLDEYIQNTENGIEKFSGASRCKAILIVNPAEPPVHMHTTIMAKVSNPKLNDLKSYLYRLLPMLRTYIPGYELIVEPTLENGRIFVSIRVKGSGDFLPEYAGNLDVINCAGLAFARRCASHFNTRACK